MRHSMNMLLSGQCIGQIVNTVIAWAVRRYPRGSAPGRVEVCLGGKRVLPAAVSAAAADRPPSTQPMGGGPSLSHGLSFVEDSL